MSALRTLPHDNCHSLNYITRRQFGQNTRHNTHSPQLPSLGIIVYCADIYVDSYVDAFQCCVYMRALSRWAASVNKWRPSVGRDGGCLCLDSDGEDSNLPFLEHRGAA